MSLVLSPSSIAESGATNSSTVTAMLSGKSSEQVTVEVSVPNGSPVTLTANATLTFAAGATVSTGTVTVTAVDNDVDAPNVSVLVSGVASGGGVSDPPAVSLTITDDDTAPATASLSVSPVSVGEEDSATTVTVTVTLGGSTTFDEDKTVAVTVGEDGDTAVSDTDYAGVSGFSVTITAGESSGKGTFSLAPIQDTLDEDDEKLTVHATAAGLTVSDAEVTITDDDALPELTVADASVAEGGKAVFTVTLSAVSGRDVTVGWTTGDDAAEGANQATADTDYAAQTTAATVTIAAGSGSGTVEVQTTEDSVVEGDETFVVTLASPSNATLGTASTATGTIIDDDERGVTVTTSAGVAVPEGGLTVHEVDKTETQDVVENVVSYEVALSSQPSGTVTISVTSGDTTTATVSPQTLTFTPSDWDAETVTVTAVDDDVDNTGDRRKTTITHAVTSTGNDYDAETVGSVAVTVTDDEGTPTATLVLTPATISESGNGNASTVTATLSGKSDRGVTVTVSVPAQSPVTLTANKTLSFAAGATASTGTVTVTAVDNDVDAPNKTVAVSGAASGGGVGDPSPATLTITDDEATPTASLVLTPSTISESGQTNSSTVTATLSGKSHTAVTVEVSVPAQSPVTLTANKTLTFAAGATASTGTVTVTAVDNDVDAPNVSVAVSGVASGGGVGDPSDVTLTITDDEGAPTVTLSLSPATINESGNGNASTVTATLSGKSDRGVTVTVSVPAQSPVTLTTNKTLTFAAGATVSTGVVTVTAVDNTVDAANVVVVVSGAASGGGVGDPSAVSLTISDDDTAPTTAALSVSPSSVGEGDSATTVTVTATLAGSVTFAEDTTVLVKVGKQGDSAVSGTDYIGVSDVTLTITAGQLSGSETFSLAPRQDALDEDDEKLSVHATATGLTISDAEVAITDDDPLPEVTIAAASVAEGGKAEFTVTLDAVSGRDVTVQWTTGDDATEGASRATADTDYTAFTTAQTLTIAAGSATGTVEVQTTEDSIAEDDETFVVTLSDPTNATLGTASTATGTISDDDTAPTTAALSVSPVSVGEGASATTVTVTATLAGSVTFPADKAVLVKVGKDGDSAVSGTDYIGVSDVTLTITAGERSGEGTFSLAPRQDALDEDDESLTVHATAAGLTVSDAEVAITDDDDPPEVTVGDASVAEGGKAVFTVTLSAVSGRDVTVGWTTGDDAAEGASQATADTDYAAQTTAASLTIAAGSGSGTVEVQTTEDSVVEGDETFVVTLSDPTNATLGTASTATGTITDDDEAPTKAALSVSPVSVGEGASATTVTVTATLAGSVTFAEDKTVAVTVGEDGDTAVSDTDYAGVSGFSVTITAGESSGKGTFSLAPIQDTLDEDDEKLSVHATAAGLTVSDAEVAITDDDAVPEVTIAAASVVEGGKAEFTVTLDAVSGRDVSVGWTTGDDGAQGASQATADTDYTAQTTAATLTIAAGSGSGTVEVQTTEDSVAEGDETFVVTLSDPTNATLGSPSSATGTIADDDEVGVTLSDPAGVAVPAGGLTAHEVDDPDTDKVENVVSYEVALSSKPSGTVTISVASGDVTVATVVAEVVDVHPVGLGRGDGDGNGGGRRCGQHRRSAQDDYYACGDVER